MALWVDRVGEVARALAENFKPVPAMDGDPRGFWLNGLVQCENRPVLRLDVEKLAGLQGVEE